MKFKDGSLTKVLVGYPISYTVEFGKALSKDTTLILSTSSSVVLFPPYGTSPFWGVAGQVECKAKSTSCTFKTFWIKAIESATLMVSENIGGELGTATLKVKAEVEKFTLKISDGELKLGQSFQVRCIYSRVYSAECLDPQWSYDTDKLGYKNSSYADGSLCDTWFEAKKVGKTLIKLEIDGRDQAVNSGFIFGCGELEVDIKSPYTLSMVNPVDFACLGSTLSYRINGLINNPSIPEVISWNCSNNGKLTSAQGSNPASFKIISEGSYFKVGAVVIANGKHELSADKNVWIGKPTVSQDIVREYTMDAGSELTLEINDFNHYMGDITYAIESGMTDKLTIEELSSKSFKIVSKHPRLLTDVLKVRFTASNPCGSVFSVYTIHVEAAPGSSYDKPLYLCSLSDHRVSHYSEYNLDEIAGDMKDFKLYFSFELLRKADFYPLRAVIGQTDMLFKVYNAERKEVNSFVPSGDEPYSVIEVPAGLYYWVVDVKRINLEMKLNVAVRGMVRGLYLHYPYVVDVKEGTWEFHDSRDTTSYFQEFYYFDEQGQEVRTLEENNIYYIMTLKKPTPLLVHSADSKTSTEVHIMQGEPYHWKVLYHERGSSLDYLAIKEDPDIPQEVKDKIYEGQTCFKRIFEPGEYRLVFNAAKLTNGGVHNGLVCVNILPYWVQGTSFANAYELGTFTGREFNAEQSLPDISIHRRLGLEYIYFHFAVEKNVGLSVGVDQDRFPLALYDSRQNKIIENTNGVCLLPDVANMEFYVEVKIGEASYDSLTLNLEGVFRGNSPINRSYNIGNYDTDFSFGDSVDTSVSRYYEPFRYNDGTSDDHYPIITPEANHIYYAITLLKAMEIELEMPGDYGYVEYHIMIGEPYEWRPFVKGTTYNTRKYIMKIPAGEYKLVFNFIKLSNGSAWNGLINLNITGRVV